MKRFFVCLSIFLFVFSGIAIAEEKAKVPNLKIPSAEVLKSVNQELVTATVGDPKTFNPITSSETSSSAIYGYVFEGLIEQDPITLEFEPNLAKRWEVDKSGLIWTFYLRDDVKWNDGQHKFTAKDVLFTLNAIYGGPNGMQDILTIDGKKIEAKIINDFTIQFILPVRFAPFLSVMQWPILPEFVLGESLKNGTFESQWNISTNPKKLIGTGPYKLVEYESTQHAKYERNPHYWKKDEKKTNPKLLWFEDLNFLKAVNHAIDKESIIVSVLYGMGKIAPAIIAPSNHIFTNKDLKDYKYDPDLAEEILEKAGYIDRDNDGIREDENGSKLEFDLSTNAGNNTREKLCSIIKQDLEDIGIKVNFRPLEFNTLVQKLMDNYEWDAIVIGLTGGSEPHNGANVYKSSGKLHVWNPAQEKPATKWEEELDRLVSQGAQELDLEKRIKIYHHLQEILHENLPFIVLPRSISYTAYNKNIENYFSTVFGTYKLERIFLNK